MGIFDLPPEEVRLNDKGFIQLSKKENRGDPDLYVLTLCFRKLIAFNFLVYVVCLFLTVFYASNSMTKFALFLLWVDVVAPFSIMIVMCYCKVFIKNVDQKKFNLLNFKGTEKKNPNAFYMAVLLPLFIYMWLFPSGSIIGIFDTRIFSPFKVLFDSYPFIITAGAFWFIAYSAVGLVILLSSLILLKLVQESKIYDFYKGKK